MDPLSECVCRRFLTVLVQEQLVEAQPAGLLADEAVHVLGAVVVNGDGVFQRLDARLQAERNLGVADGVPKRDTSDLPDVCCFLLVKQIHNLYFRGAQCFQAHSDAGGQKQMNSDF